MPNSIASNRSALKDFLASIAVIRGDLSNITAPPFVLGEFSTVELPQYWADHPTLFVAPALETDVEKRALLVLKWFLGSLRNQQYAGRKEEDGVKKPLNAFLGELFIGHWDNASTGQTRLVCEQVSHHPPVTACYLWNDEHGIRAEGFTQQEITFSGSVSIKQKGYAILHIDRYDEDYLIPVPNVKVKGVLSGTPYPELVGEYSIISSTGIVSAIKFHGKSLLGSGDKNSFEARVYKTDAPHEDLFTAEGLWSDKFSIRDSSTGEVVDEFDVKAQESVAITVPERSKQDPWESRRAWGDVLDALSAGDMKGTADAKSVVEQGQRRMRKDEEARGEKWQRVFYKNFPNDAIFEKLSAVDPASFSIDSEGGIWKVDGDSILHAKKPFHGKLLPSGLEANDTVVNGHGDPSKSEPKPHETNGLMQAPSSQAETHADDESPSKPAKSTTTEVEFTTIQIEEMLRNKYSSAPR